MILIDVSILVYAHRTDADDHATYRNGLDETLNSAETYGLCGTGLVRNGANRHSPANLCRSHADRPGTGTGEPLAGPRFVRRRFSGRAHWRIFAQLCRASGAKGNLFSDAYFAALSMEFAAEWITADRDYARFPGLRWRHPLIPGHGG
jgi:predicted nucleic acid-binding protein